MVVEYLYRHDVFPGLTHDGFLDEPRYTREWMWRIHQTIQGRQGR